jgi:hypothetical protein
VLLVAHLQQDGWHAVNIQDVNKLTADLVSMGFAVATPPIIVKPRKRGKKAEKKTSTRQVRDQYNDHVPEAYKNDEWKIMLSDSAQIYGKH